MAGIWAMIWLVCTTTLSAANICTECECAEIGLMPRANDSILCADKPGWLYPTSRVEDFLSSTLFVTFEKIPLIELTDPVKDFQGIPPGQLRGLTFRQTEIDIIPPDYFSHNMFNNLTFLAFDGSKLSDLDQLLSTVSQALSINELILINNPFDVINKEMFSHHGLNIRLEALSIGHNPIILPADVFDVFSGYVLKALSLDGLAIGADENFLKRLLTPVLYQLQHLELSDVGLQAVPKFLGRMSNLKELILSNNGITSLDKGVDSMTRCLSYTGSYSNSTFYFNEGLEQLSMDYNQLEVLDTRALPTSLIVLDLSFNIISDIKYGFTKFSDLILLVLSSNRIKAIPPDFSHPTDNPSLLYLDFQNNRLSSLNGEWLAAYEAMVPSFPLTLLVSSNPYNCLCGMEPLVEYIYLGALLNHTDVLEIDCYMADRSSRNLYKELINGTLTDTSDVSSIKSCTVSHLCDTLDVNRIDCSDRVLPVIPPNLPGTPWFVDLSQNNIQSMVPSYLDTNPGSAGIKILDLSYNLIGPNLAHRDAKNLNQLTYLDLSHNRITTIGPHTFLNNSMLEYIDLSYNYITSICHVQGNVSQSLWYPLALSSTQLDLSHNQIGGLPCNAFSMHLKTDDPLTSPVPDSTTITWHSLDLSHNCITLNASNKELTDFYQPATSNFSGFGLKELTGELDLSYNFIQDFNFLFVHELGELSCAGELNVENNLIEYIDNTSIQSELVPKWSVCGSSLLLGNNPYDCACPSIDFWIYHNQTDSTNLQYIDFTSSMECMKPSQFMNTAVYNIEYPFCACQSGVNPCFVYGNNTKYYSDCFEVVFSIPPEARCGPCPSGFTGDGITCIATDPCVDNPCFTDSNDPSLYSVCTQIGPGTYDCLGCPAGMTGSGYGSQGCQDIDMCQIYSCYSDKNVTLVCTDLPPPSTLIACEPCPHGLTTVLNKTGCMVEGQCCEDDNPCADNSTNLCFLSNTCVNKVWPLTDISCDPCPEGTKDLSPPLGYSCDEIDECLSNPCYKHTSSPAICTDIPWTVLIATSGSFQCTCAAGTTGIGVGIFGCHDIDGCVHNPCWEDLFGLKVRAHCTDIPAYPGMTDPTEVNCTCPEGTLGDGYLVCYDTDPCLMANPCYVNTSCSVVSPPFDEAVCGPCPAGYFGDGRTCTDIDECSEATQPACYPSLACEPTPAPHTDGKFKCIGQCSCGMMKVSGGRGSGGCIDIDVCRSANPCSIDSTCKYDQTQGSSVSCGDCAAGQLPVDECQHPGTKSCCLSNSYFTLRLNPSINSIQNVSGSVPVAGVLQIYSNGVWGDVVYSNFSDASEEQRLLTYTADAVCRHLGFSAGHASPATSVLSNEPSNPMISLICRFPKLSIMDCDHSMFYGDNTKCTPPTQRHYITCNYGITGYHLGSTLLPNEGIVYVSYNPSAADLCSTNLLPVCYQPSAEMLQTAMDICLNLGYPGLYCELRSSDQDNTSCALIEDDLVISVTGELSPLYLHCHDGVATYRLVEQENYLQMKIDGYSYNNDDIYWGYLLASHYMNLRPGFKSHNDWDRICRSLGFSHMVTVGTEMVRDRDDKNCRSWVYWHSIGHTLNHSCEDGDVIYLMCSTNAQQVRIVDSLHKPSLKGRVDVRTEGAWQTLTVYNRTQATFELASAACVSAGYYAANWWLTADLSTTEITATYGTSSGGGRAQLLIGEDFTCDLESGGLLACSNQWPDRLSADDAVESVYGRMVTVAVDTGYTLVVECGSEPQQVELSKGHYGQVTSERDGIREAVCVDFDPICASYSHGTGTVPDSRIADAFCWSLGYGAGYTVPPDSWSDMELPHVVYGRQCLRTGYCDRELRSCNIGNGDHLLAIRCLDAYDACAPNTNTCFWNESCVDLPNNEQSLCQCPSGYEGDGHSCTDINECTNDLNPCFDPASCEPVAPPIDFGEVQVDGPTCSPCPEGTVDADEGQPGRICLEQNGCVPNLCNEPTTCTDVTRSLDSQPGYTCGSCGAGYVPSLELDCLFGKLVPGSVNCCVDADACIRQPCKMGKKCFDLPAPASAILGFTCDDCPLGTQHNSSNNKCEDINHCEPQLTPCDENAFCQDLPPPSLDAVCRCYAGYYQNTTAMVGTCLEVDLCGLEPGLCGVGRVCYDLPPPKDPYLFDVTSTLCGSCAPGYLPGPHFILTLQEYILATEANILVRRDCVEFDACADSPDACFKFPGNASYDVRCVDVPATEYIPNGITYRCLQCPMGMSGSGYGPGGCSNINSCESGPCDSIAIECIDSAPPEHGFHCVCPFRTIGVGIGNAQCVDVDACQEGDNPCMFPDLCVDLPYSSDKLYRCDCPPGTYHVSERGCGDIDGCISTPCYGECTDVPYTDLPPGSNGTDVVCEPCLHGTLGNGIGSDGCKEIDVCSASFSHLLCYHDPDQSLTARCIDVKYRELLPTDPVDLYRCVCPPGMAGAGDPYTGCSNIDYCELDVCGNNTVCKDYPPPSTEYSCVCAAGFRFDSHSEQCVAIDHCGSTLSTCDPRMSCINALPPNDPHSTRYPIAYCSHCPVGTVDVNQTVFMINGTVVGSAKCTEIDGCLHNDTACWVNPFINTSLCEDVSSSLLNPAKSTGYEFKCHSCPRGMEGNGYTVGGQIGCTEIDGCRENRCFVNVDCYDVPWQELLPTQHADDYICGECPGDLKGDGKTCTGGCDFEKDLCGGEVVGSWYRAVGLLSDKTGDNINNDPLPGEAPLFDHTYSYSSRGKFLALDASEKSAVTSKFVLPLINEPGVYNIIFYIYYNGPHVDDLIVRQNYLDGNWNVLWKHDIDSGNTWFGVINVYALASKAFSVSFEYVPKLRSADQVTDKLSYIAIDDIYLDTTDWHCNHNQLCSPQALCLKYPSGYDYGDDLDYKCYCDPNFTGQFCEVYINPCDSNPCLGNSTCMFGDGSYSCLCPSTLTGMHCEEDVNECEMIPPVCAFGGSCMSSHGSHYCLCPPSLTGSSCRLNIDDCIGADCGHGLCYDMFNNDIACVCSDGFKGADCSINIDTCHSNPCLNNGTCSDEEGPFTCICNDKYHGDTCELSKNNCLGIECINEGSCIDGSDGWECRCPPTYGGKLCKEDIWACEIETCSDNGICIEGLDDPRCLCTEPGCQLKFDCTPTRGKHMCVCEMGYGGTRCEVPPDPCTSNPCVHGNCIRLSSQKFNCQCKLGYQGNLCTMNIDECASTPCENSGECYSLEGSFRCRCLLGYTGDTCAINVDDCQHSLCLNAAQCVDEVHDFNCLCPKRQYIGALCELAVSEMVVANSSALEFAALQDSRTLAVNLSSVQCTTWSSVNKELKLEIIGFALLTTIAFTLLQLCCCLHRIKSYNNEYSQNPLHVQTPVSRLSARTPPRGLQYYYASPQFQKSANIYDVDYSPYSRRS